MNDALHSDVSGQAEWFWEEHYRGHDRVWSGSANPVLVDVVGSLQPGTALDLGRGEGGDAIWLAQLGWRVIAVDVSATAVDRASAHATTAGVGERVDFQRHDLAVASPPAPSTWSPPSTCTRRRSSRANTSCGPPPAPWFQTACC